MTKFLEAVKTMLPLLRRRHLDGRDGIGGRCCARIGCVEDQDEGLLDVPCDCGADEHNAAVDELLAQARNLDESNDA